MSLIARCWIVCFAQIDEKMAALKEAAGGELLDDLRKLQARQLKLKESRSELRGAMASEEKHAADLIKELTGERYRRIDERHTNALIDVRTHMLANADLDTYYRALDKALMSFHSIKMKEINESDHTLVHSSCMRCSAFSAHSLLPSLCSPAGR